MTYLLSHLSNVSSACTTSRAVLLWVRPGDVAHSAGRHPRCHHRAIHLGTRRAKHAGAAGIRRRRRFRRHGVVPVFLVQVRPRGVRGGCRRWTDVQREIPLAQLAVIRELHLEAHRTLIQALKRESEQVPRIFDDDDDQGFGQTAARLARLRVKGQRLSEAIRAVRVPVDIAGALGGGELVCDRVWNIASNILPTIPE